MYKSGFIQGNFDESKIKHIIKPCLNFPKLPQPLIELIVFAKNYYKTWPYLFLKKALLQNKYDVDIRYEISQEVKDIEGLKLTILLALIFAGIFVFGFRPIRSFLFNILKVPNDVIFILLYLINSEIIDSIKSSTSDNEKFLEKPKFL